MNPADAALFLARPSREDAARRQALSITGRPHRLFDCLPASLRCRRGLLFLNQEPATYLRARPGAADPRPVL